jgi:hypothetical protein
MEGPTAGQSRQGQQNSESEVLDVSVKLVARYLLNWQPPTSPSAANPAGPAGEAGCSTASAWQLATASHRRHVVDRA